MGFIRGGLFVFVSVLLLISLLAGNLFWSMNKSLEYENVKSELTPIIKGVVEKEMDLDNVVRENIDVMQDYCANNTDVNEYVFKEGDFTFEISCDNVNLGSDAVVQEGVESLIEDSYYQTYDCSLLSCFSEMEYPLFLVSEQTKNKSQNWFYLALVISLVLVILAFVLAEKKSNAFIIIGSLVILSSLPFMKLNWFLENSDNVVLNFITVFFSNSYSIFITMIAIGIIVFALGILLKFFNIGFKIHEFFSKFKKGGSKGNIVKPVAKTNPVVSQKTNVVMKK